MTAYNAHIDKYYRNGAFNNRTYEFSQQQQERYNVNNGHHMNNPKNMNNMHINNGNNNHNHTTNNNEEIKSDINMPVSFSDHIIYCFDRKFSNYYIECNSFEQQLKNKYPFNIRSIAKEECCKYRFLRKKNDRFYYLQIEPDDICPFGTECKWIQCARIHYISNEDICDDSYDNIGCGDNMCFKIHIGDGQRLSDRICSLLYDSYQRRDIIDESLKFNEYKVSLLQFMRAYESKYGEFIGYNSNNASDGMMSELKRVLLSYGSYYTYDHNERGIMRKYRLWRLISNADYIQFDSIGMWKKICFNHMDNHCKFNPSYLCPWLHPDKLLVCLLSKCPNHHNGTGGCNIFHIQRKFTQYPIKQVYYPLLKSSKSIKYELHQIYHSPATNMNINSSKSTANTAAATASSLVAASKHNNTQNNSNNVNVSQCPRDFLHFADQLIDCFGRDFNETNWMSFDEIGKKLKLRFPKIREIYWSKYRFLRYKFVEKEKYLRLKIENEDICPMGHNCSWFGCSRIHHISHEEIIYGKQNKNNDSDKALMLQSEKRFVDKMVSVLMSQCNNNKEMNDKSLSECKFWLNDLLIIYDKYYPPGLQLDGFLTSEFKKNYILNADLASFFNEYGKFYVVNEENGHTEYIQLWYIEYDEILNKLYLKINRDISNKICYDYMYNKCHYCPLSFCPFIHVDKRLVAMNDSCSCRQSHSSCNNNNKCSKYHLKTHHLRVANKQRYESLSRSIKEIKKYIQSVKLHKNNTREDHNFANDDEEEEFQSVSANGYNNKYIAKWSEYMDDMTDMNMSKPFNYIKIEWLDNDANYHKLQHKSHLQLIDQLFNLFVLNYHIEIVDICINGTRKNIGLKYEITRNQEATLFNLWQFFRGKTNDTKTWCYNRIIKMKMIDMKCFRDDGTFILFELQGMNPFVSVQMARTWFENKLFLWKFINLKNLKYKDGTLQFLVKPNKYSSTNHAEIFVLKAIIKNRINPFKIFDIAMKLNNSNNNDYIPWIHQERYFFSDHSNLDTYNIMKQRHTNAANANAKEKETITESSTSAESNESREITDNAIHSEANAMSLELSKKGYHIPKQNCYFADRILDCCLRNFHCATSYGDLEYFMKQRYDSKDIFWHKYRFPQTDNNGYCFMNIQCDDICPMGDECKWLRCCRLHHISSQEICVKKEKCKKIGKSCNKLHLHSQRLVDRIASVFLYEYNNYILSTSANKDLADCYIFLGKFLVIYQMLYDINFESLLYEMNLPKMKQQFPSRFADVAVFLIEYGRYPYFMDDEDSNDGYFLNKQLWNVSMYKDDHTPHITINPVIIDIVCYDHMNGGCRYKPHYQCPYLHLDLKFVASSSNCQQCMKGENCNKYHILSSKLKRPPKQKYKPLLRSMNDIKECIENMRNIYISYPDQEDKKHEIKWNKTLLKSFKNNKNNYDALDHAYKYVNIEWEVKQNDGNTQQNHSHIKLLHELYKLALSNYKVPIVDIYINSTKKIVSLMYKVKNDHNNHANHNNYYKLWYELKKIIKRNVDGDDDAVWCFNRIIKIRLNEMNLDDGLYIIFEFQPMNSLISIDLTKTWFQHKINSHFKFNHLLNTFLIYIDGTIQYIKLQHFNNYKNNAYLYLYNSTDIKKLTQRKVKKTKIYKGKLPINITPQQDIPPTNVSEPHRIRKFYDHSPPETIEVLLKKYQQIRLKQREIRKKQIAQTEKLRIQRRKNQNKKSPQPQPTSPPQPVIINAVPETETAAPAPAPRIIDNNTNNTQITPIPIPLPDNTVHLSPTYFSQRTTVIPPSYNTYNTKSPVFGNWAYSFDHDNSQNVIESSGPISLDELQHLNDLNDEVKTDSNGRQIRYDAAAAAAMDDNIDDIPVPVPIPIPIPTTTTTTTTTIATTAYDFFFNVDV